MALPLLKDTAMSFFTKHFPGIVLIGLFAGFNIESTALTLEELHNDPKLTPEQFASYFSEFEFKFHPEVQNHTTFLGSRSGDCDDYATLAAEILGKKGYTTQLIAVRMKGETHVVCYINETKSYLDYNYRKGSSQLTPCSDSITEIAGKVAKSFERDWIATYQFTYSALEGVKRLVQNIITNSSTHDAS